MAGQPILATLQFASGNRSLRTSEDDGKYKAVSDIKVHDLRSSELTYAKNGISIIHIDTKMSLEDFANKEVIEHVYLAEIENHLVKVLGAKSVFIFDWVLRQGDADSSSTPEQGFTPRQPALFAHIGRCYASQSIKRRESSIRLIGTKDYTSTQVADRVCSLFGERASTLLMEGRYEVVKYARRTEQEHLDVFGSALLY
jgi:hypothetical protein